MCASPERRSIISALDERHQQSCAAVRLTSSGDRQKYLVTGGPTVHPSEGVPMADSSVLLAGRRAFFAEFADLMYARRDVRAAREGEPAAAVVDLDRADGDLIVEHWDVIQPWPTSAAHDHPMF